MQFSIFVTPTLAFSGGVLFYFLRGWVFVRCFAFCFCYASCLIASCAVHLHVFIKHASVVSCLFFLVSIDLSQTDHSVVARPFDPLCTILKTLCLHGVSSNPSCVCPKTPLNPTRAVITVVSGSSPNIYKISLFSLLDSLAIFFRDRPFSIRGTEIALNLICGVYIVHP